MTNRKLFLPFLLILLVQMSLAQTVETEKADEIEKQAVELLRETSQDVSGLRTLENRISFSAELAGLMWFHDEKQARAMYQLTIKDFRELLSQIEAEYNSLDAAEQTEEISDSVMFGGGGGSSKAVLMRKFGKAMSVRQQIALSIAKHDPQMGYEFFVGTAQIFTNAQLVTQFSQRDVFIELKLLDLMAERDVDKTIEAGRKLLAKGKTFELLGLLKKIYEKDDKKGAAFGEELLSKIKADAGRADSYYYYGQILSLGAENMEKTKDTPDKKPIFTMDSLRQIADLYALEILKRERNEFSDVEGTAALIEKFSPARAAQIRLKFKDTKTAETNSSSNRLETRVEMRNNSQTENAEQQQKMFEDVKKLADKQLPKEDREKIIVQARQIISKVKDREQKIIALSLLASQVANLGDKELALEIMTEAKNLAPIQPKNFKDYLGVWMLASGYAQVDGEKAFPILEDTILRLNQTIAAFIKVAEFIDVNNDFIEDEEVQVGSFGGELTRGLLSELGQSSQTISALAKTDFARTKNLANKFDRLEVRILAKMLILRAVLGGKPKNEE